MRSEHGTVHVGGLSSFVLLVLLAAGCATGGGAEPAHPPMIHTAPPEAERPVDPVAALPGLPDGVRLVDGAGEPLDWDELVRRAGDVEVILLGEIHDDTVGHQARHALVAERIAAGDALAISLEMFEADVQVVLDEYLSGVIPEDQFLRASRPWDNYDPDYRPYVEMARTHDLPVVAANAPRRYANLVSREGPEALSPLSSDALGWLPPLPYPGPSQAYRAEWDALMGEAGAHAAGEAGERMLMAQALWDASMARAIADVLDRPGVERVVHVAGAFHVENGTGVAELLEHYRPGTSTLIVVGYPVAAGEGFDPIEHGGMGDAIFLSPR